MFYFIVLLCTQCLCAGTPDNAEILEKIVNAEHEVENAECRYRYVKKTLDSEAADTYWAKSASGRKPTDTEYYINFGFDGKREYYDKFEHDGDNSFLESWKYDGRHSSMLMYLVTRSGKTIPSAMVFRNKHRQQPNRSIQYILFWGTSLRDGIEGKFELATEFIGEPEKVTYNGKTCYRLVTKTVYDAENSFVYVSYASVEDGYRITGIEYKLDENAKVRSRYNIEYGHMSGNARFPSVIVDTSIDTETDEPVLTHTYEILGQPSINTGVDGSRFIMQFPEGVKVMTDDGE